MYPFTPYSSRPMKLFTLLAFSALALLASPGSAAPASTNPPETGADIGIRLGLQAYTFRDFTFVETLEKAKAAGIRYIQAYGGQELGGGLPGKFNFSMDDATRAKVRALLKKNKIEVVSYGVVTGKDEAEWRQIFTFAKAMGLHDIATEPKAEALALVDQLSRESGVRVALHNHPTPSIYANPDFALATVKPFGPNLGLCADTGHWVRSGYDPIESLRKAEGKIISLHFKDLTERGVKAAHDVPWGTGASDAAGQIAELRRQHFSGYVFVEYEHNTPELEQNVIRSAEYFRRALAASEADLAGHAVVPPDFTARPEDVWAKGRGKDSQKWDAPTPLFARDLGNAEFKKGSWAWEKGELVAKGGGDLWTKESYGDVVVMLEFRCEKATNSGVFLRCTDPVNWLQHSLEIQILQGDAKTDRQLVGALYDCLAPTRQIEIAPGEWHQFVITAKGSKITATLDGEEILKADLNQWTEAGRNPDGTPNKFDHALKEHPRSGRIGLQYHGEPVAFRNLFVERL